jgi:serine/threonine-protein kinase RIO1
MQPNGLRWPTEFPTEKIFYEIRLAPYLMATAERHPQLANALHALVAQTQDNAKTLVHGDVSPKNILLGKERACFIGCGMRHME